MANEKNVEEQVTTQFKNRRFIIIPGLLCEHSNPKSVKAYLELIRTKLFRYEPESRANVSFLLKRDPEEIKFHLKSIPQPFIVLLLRDVAANDFIVFEKFARKNKKCKVYYEGRREKLSYYDEEEMEIKNKKISIRNIHNYEETLELFLVLTKKELDLLANAESKNREN